LWLLGVPGADAVGFDAWGAAGRAVAPDLYERQGLSSIPSRGPLAANTVAGTLAGWDAALALSRSIGGSLTLERLLRDAIFHAESGFPVTRGQAQLASAKAEELRKVPGFAETFLEATGAPAPGTIFRQPRLGATLRALARDGIEDFYRGKLARRVAADLARAGSPIGLADLAAHEARLVRPLSLDLACGTVFNLPPPTQGLASLMILGIYERLGVREPESFAYVHALVEATKQAFAVRDREIGDPAGIAGDLQAFLAAPALSERAAHIDPERAAAWHADQPPSDTVWLGAIDRQGIAVSFIQSTYWEFGSGVVLADTGILWQNRGTSFRLEPGAPNALGPGRKPFHTLNPALARLRDGRTMVYGTMGGDGQPQTQAALFTRHILFAQDIQQAVTAPRWLLGRTWGARSTTLKIEEGFGAEIAKALSNAGHVVELVPRFDPVFGHAGAVVRHPAGLIKGAADPRSDGRAAAF
jgi:gamma-glutamyltranspeptidase/glutathione hydrolase